MCHRRCVIQPDSHKCRLVPGQWLGPWVLCHALETCVNRVRPGGLSVHVVASPGGGAPVLYASRCEAAGMPLICTVVLLRSVAVELGPRVQLGLWLCRAGALCQLLDWEPVRTQAALAWGNATSCIAERSSRWCSGWQQSPSVSAQLSCLRAGCTSCWRLRQHLQRQTAKKLVHQTRRRLCSSWCPSCWACTARCAATLCWL